MAGNYSVDALMDGWWGVDPAPWPVAFRPPCMQLVDVFIYFSHNLVSLPPSGWIHAAHRHGARVFGTLLTEWDEGATQCRILLENVDQVASQLTAMANTYGFDGWLVNIEHPVDRDTVPALLDLVGSLSQKMHPRKVLWYDSVIVGGDLRWQNGLNEFNLPFFEKASGGIFTNYGWREERLRTSVKTAGSRNADVWHGIDVWGRGTLGDGGMNCAIALDAIAMHGGKAAAIFAPGWYVENEQAANRDIARARALGDEFWARIAAVTGDLERVVLPSRPLRFFTDFCDGGGLTCSVQGRLALPHPWLDLRRHMLQARVDALYPAASSTSSTSMTRLVSCRYCETGPVFSGGGCLELHAEPGLVVPGEEDETLIPLLAVHADLTGTSLTVRLAILPGSAVVGLFLDVGASARIMLAPSSLKGASSSPSTRAIHFAAPDEPIPHSPWSLRTWRVPKGDDHALIGVGAVVFSPRSGPVDARLGMISLVEESDDQSSEPGRVCNVTVTPMDNTEMVRVSWQCSKHAASPPHQLCACWAFVHVMLHNSPDNEDDSPPVLLQTMCGLGGTLTSRPGGVVHENVQLHVVGHTGLVEYQVPLGVASECACNVT